MPQEPDDCGQNPVGQHAVVLIVEDEPLIRMATADMLGELGYRVLEAGDAREALTVLKSTDGIDILLTDLKLLGMSGAELIDAARALRPGLKVVVVTGYALTGDSGADYPENVRVLAKPFQLGQLRDALQDSP